MGVEGTAETSEVDRRLPHRKLCLFAFRSLIQIYSCLCGKNGCGGRQGAHGQDFRQCALPSHVVGHATHATCAGHRPRCYQRLLTHRCHTLPNRSFHCAIQRSPTARSPLVPSQWTARAGLDGIACGTCSHACLCLCRCRPYVASVISPRHSFARVATDAVSHCL